MKSNKVTISIEALNDEGEVSQNLTLTEGGALVITFDKDNNLLTKTHAVGSISLEGFGMAIGKILYGAGYTRKVVKPFAAGISNTMYELDKMMESNPILNPDPEDIEVASTEFAPEDGEEVVEEVVVEEEEVR